jgi:hypothetical protein
MQTILPKHRCFNSNVEEGNIMMEPKAEQIFGYR